MLVNTSAEQLYSYWRTYFIKSTFYILNQTTPIMAVNLVTVKTYSSSFDANLALAKLNDSGIQAVIQNEETILINPGILNSTAIRLMVESYDLEKAAEVLNN